MSEPNEDARPTARPASVDDLGTLLTALNEHGVDYLLIGGYALYALGYQRGTTDIDLLLHSRRANRASEPDGPCFACPTRWRASWTRPGLWRERRFASPTPLSSI